METDRTKGQQRRICGHLCELVELRPADVVSVCRATLTVDKAALGAVSGADEPTLEMAVQQLLAVAAEAEAAGGLPQALTANELKINDMDFVEAYASRNVSVGSIRLFAANASCLDARRRLDYIRCRCSRCSARRSMWAHGVHAARASRCTTATCTGLPRCSAG